MVKPAANTELTIAFIRIIESVMCLLCLITHIKALNYEEPMPHIVLFCGTFGGFFILSLAKLVVPISGQLSPPGVDLVFSFIGFILFYVAACAAMFFVQNDPHLVAINGKAATINEIAHPFFQHCVKHAILSLTTGTLFLMHAVISADRLASILKGIEEDVEREIEEDDIDIYPDDTISLHLFFLNWLIMLWNTMCCRSIRRFFKKCQMSCIEFYRKKCPPSDMPRRRIYRRARMIKSHELKRLNGITVSDVAPQEFIRNPRRTLANNDMVAFMENGSIIKKPRSVDNEQGHSSHSQDGSLIGRKRTPRNVIWDIQENGSTNQPSIDLESGIRDSNIKTSRENTSADYGPLDSGWETRVSFIRNKEFGSDDDLPIVHKKKQKSKVDANPSKKNTIHSSRLMSFIRNEAFNESDEDLNKNSNIIWETKNTFKTSYDSDNLVDLSANITKKRSISFIRNEEFGSEEDISEKAATNAYSNDGTERRQVSFTRNKDFGGSERESKIGRFFKWFSRKAESVPTIDENTIRAIETFSSEALDSQPDSRANSKEVSLSGFEDKSNFLQGRRPKTEQEIPISDNQETNQSIVSAASSTFSKTQLINTNQGTPRSITFENIVSYPYAAPNIQYRINEDTSEKNKLENEKESVSYLIPIPQNNTRNKKSTVVTSENIATSAQPPIFSTPNLIPYILTSKINKGLEIISGKEIANTETKQKIQTTDFEYDTTSYMKKIANLIPSNKMSTSTSEKETKKTDNYSNFPGTSYLQTITDLIPSSRNTVNSSRKQEKKKSKDKIKKKK